MSEGSKKLVILVSSTVYGIEELLDRVFTILTAFGYEVWMSHKGTLPTRSDKTAFENCLQAVDDCDLFLGIITPRYGSGVDRERDEISITHQELRKAIDLEKPRWLLVHSEVVFARRLLRDLGYDSPEKRSQLSLKDDASSLTDLRVVELYEEALRNREPLSARDGNWVQKFSEDEDALLFAAAQFSRFQEVERFIHENLIDPERVRERLTGRPRK
jgi:hypothetical protein